MPQGQLVFVASQNEGALCVSLSLNVFGICSCGLLRAAFVSAKLPASGTSAGAAVHAATTPCQAVSKRHICLQEMASRPLTPCDPESDYTQTLFHEGTAM